QTTPQESFDPQPYVAPVSGLVIAADARLDSRAELIAALGLPSERQHSDAALILAAYARWGEDAPSHLLGDFAFAIWDRAEHRFSLARDYFGVKQLYYYRSNRLFAFATEIKALLALPDVPRRLNERRLADMLLGLGDDSAGTLYADVFRLPPATSMLVSAEAA